MNKLIFITIPVTILLVIILMSKSNKITTLNSKEGANQGACTNPGIAACYSAHGSHKNCVGRRDLPLGGGGNGCFCGGRGESSSYDQNCSCDNKMFSSSSGCTKCAPGYTSTGAITVEGVSNDTGCEKKQFWDCQQTIKTGENKIQTLNRFCAKSDNGVYATKEDCLTYCKGTNSQGCAEADDSSVGKKQWCGDCAAGGVDGCPASCAFWGRDMLNYWNPVWQRPESTNPTTEICDESGCDMYTAEQTNCAEVFLVGSCSCGPKWNTANDLKISVDGGVETTYPYP